MQSEVFSDGKTTFHGGMPSGENYFWREIENRVRDTYVTLGATRMIRVNKYE